MLLAQDQRLVEFSFASRFEGHIRPETIARLTRQSWSDNTRAGVTGFQRLAGDRIEQTIEGPCTAILALASRILTDRRHFEIVIRRFGPISARSFADWSVAGLEPTAPAPRRPDGPALRLLTTATVAPEFEAAQPLAVGRAT